STCPTSAELDTLSLHDALPNCHAAGRRKTHRPDRVAPTACTSARLWVLCICAAAHRGFIAVSVDSCKVKLCSSADELVVPIQSRSEEHTSELQSLAYLVCRHLL